MEMPNTVMEDSAEIVPPGEILKKARLAAKTGDYAVATANYELFFDRALPDQGKEHNYYGVRLSYCLMEWEHVGEKYPPALERLEAKAFEAVENFEKTCDREKFHDYWEISCVLKQEAIALKRFFGYHQTRPELAKAAAQFVWKRLIDEGEWEVSAAYLGDPMVRYRSALETFDRGTALGKANPSWGGEEFSKTFKELFVRDVGNIIIVLRKSGQAKTAVGVRESSTADLRSRGYPELISEIDARVDRIR
jgi:hypothetical protein